MTSTSSITRVQQLIVGSLLLACLLFGGLVLVMILSGRTTPAELSTGPFWLALVLLGGVAVAFPLMTERGFEQRLKHLLADDQADAAGQAIVQRTVLRAALVEGFGVCGAAFAFVTSSVPLAIAPFLSVAGLALMFPTERKTQELLRG